MTNPVPTPDLVPPPEHAPRTGILRLLYGFEDSLLVVCLAAMMLLPVAEIILRSVFHAGISGSSAIVQHLTLIVGMVGGAIAARDGRLLALSPVQTLLKGWAKTAAQIFSSGFAATICFFLCLASVQYLKDMRPLGKILVYGIPVWVILLFLPIGFGLITLRLIWRGSTKLKWRFAILALAAALCGLAVWAPGPRLHWGVAALIALGGALMPVLLAARYSERNALGLLTGAGSLGMLFPPCLPLILYAIVANTSAHADLSIKQMFLGGIGPGILLVILTAWWGIRKGPKAASSRIPFKWAEAGAALWDAKWEMLIPVVAILSLFTVPTTVEAAALTATYALLVATVIRRDLRPVKDLPRVITECGLLVGGVLLILGVALGFTHYLVDAQIPDQIVEWSTHAIASK